MDAVITSTLAYEIFSEAIGNEEFGLKGVKDKVLDLGNAAKDKTKIASKQVKKFVKQLPEKAGDAAIALGDGLSKMSKAYNSNVSDRIKAVRGARQIEEFKKSGDLSNLKPRDMVGYAKSKGREYLKALHDIL